MCARDQSSIFSTGRKFRPDYGVLLELHTLILVAGSYVLLIHYRTTSWFGHTHTLSISHLPPPPSVDVQHPAITEHLVLLIHSPSDQQLGVIISIVKTGCCMVGSLHRPGGSLRSLQLGPHLRQMTINSNMSD